MPLLEFPSSLSMEEGLTDDFVARKLTEDARLGTSRYSGPGLQGLFPERRPVSTVKPNTRFLRHILRDVDNHNTALKAKEEQEQVPRQEGTSPGSSRRDSRRRFAEDNERQHMNSYDSSKRRRRSYSEDHEYHPGRRVQPSKPSSRKKERRAESRRTNESADRLSRRTRETRHKRSSSGSASPPLRSNKRQRHTSPDLSQVKTSPSGKDHKSSSRRTQDLRMDEKRVHETSRHGGKRHAHVSSRENDSIVRERRHKSSRPAVEEPPKRVRKPAQANDATEAGRLPNDSDIANDSDPLDDIIGPRLAKVDEKVKTRGRGRFRIDTASKEMDSRFSSGYDPGLDIEPDESTTMNNANWEEALEAARFREYWKRKGAERLREAGFKEADIARWGTGTERNEDDVRWVKRGQSREWDRGKTTGDASSGGMDVELKPNWI